MQDRWEFVAHHFTSGAHLVWASLAAFLHEITNILKNYTTMKKKVMLPKMVGKILVNI